MPRRGLYQLRLSFLQLSSPNGQGGGKKTAPYWMQQAWYVSVRNDAIAFDAQRWIRHQDRGPYNLDIYRDGQDRRKFLLLSLLRQQLPDTSLRHGPKYDGRPTGHMQ